MTYSVLLTDGTELGFGIQSHFPAVGPYVGRIRRGLGVAVVQAEGSAEHAEALLDVLASGASPADSLAAVLADDPRRDHRQAAIVALDGRTAAYSGESCIPVAELHLRPGVVAIGNCLTRPGTAEAMAGACASSEPLCDRILAALDAAEAAGGDLRGQLSVAIRISGRAPREDVDLRVDNDPSAVEAMRRLVVLRRCYDVLHDAAVLSSPARLRSAILEAREVAEGEEVALWLAIHLASVHGCDQEAARLISPLTAGDGRWANLLRAVAVVEDLGALAPGQTL